MTRILRIKNRHFGLIEKYSGKTRNLIRKEEMANLTLAGHILILWLRPQRFNKWLLHWMLVEFNKLRIKNSAFPLIILDIFVSSLKAPIFSPGNMQATSAKKLAESILFDYKPATCADIQYFREDHFSIAVLVSYLSHEDS